VKCGSRIKHTNNRIWVKGIAVAFRATQAKGSWHSLNNSGGSSAKLKVLNTEYELWINFTNVFNIWLNKIKSRLLNIYVSVYLQCWTFRYIIYYGHGTQLRTNYKFYKQVLVFIEYVPLWCVVARYISSTCFRYISSWLMAYWTPLQATQMIQHRMLK
jgi:hypothetical protein